MPRTHTPTHLVGKEERHFSIILRIFNHGSNDLEHWGNPRPSGNQSDLISITQLLWLARILHLEVATPQIFKLCIQGR